MTPVKHFLIFSFGLIWMSATDVSSFGAGASEGKFVFSTISERVCSPCHVPTLSSFGIYWLIPRFVQMCRTYSHFVICVLR